MVFNLRFILLTVYTVMFVFSNLLYAQSHSILVNGVIQDWDGTSPLATDPAGDGGSSGIDMVRCWATNNEEYLYLRIELTSEILIQSNNSLRIYLDLDNNSNTGFFKQGIGADISWRFGDRVGTYYRKGSTDFLLPIHLRMVVAPSVTSTDFEMEISRKVSLDGLTELIPGGEILFLFSDEDSGDTFPDTGSLSYTIDHSSTPPFETIPLEKTNSKAIRILSYNVLRDSLFEQSAFYERILPSIQPDIFNFQEIYNHSIQDTINLVTTLFSLPGEQQWYGAENADVHTVSKYPILSQFNTRGNMGVLIDLPDQSYPNDMLIVNCHLPCCENDVGRQIEVDQIISNIRDRKNNQEIPENTAILFTGDMNFVGFSQQVQTLIAGDIQDQSTYGNDHIPDWDGTTMENLIPTHNAALESFTWWNGGSNFFPGRLDYMIYTDSIITPVKSFILRTEEMSSDQLNLYGLQQFDTAQASDHLPVVADFILNKVTTNLFEVY